MVAVLYSGACLSVIPNDIRLDIAKMNEYFISQNVTHTLITSQVGRLFMESVDETSLKVLLVGGEKLGEVQSPENYVLVDAFGPTEACVFISSIENDDKMDPSSIGPLGYNTKAYVLDKEFRRVPIGAVGELFISGSQLADGYLNRDEETKNAFLDNCVCEDNSASGATFSQCEGGGLYAKDDVYLYKNCLFHFNSAEYGAGIECGCAYIYDISVEFIVNEAHVGQMSAVYYRDESSGIEKSFWTQEDIRGSIGFRNSNLTYWGGYVSFK